MYRGNLAPKKVSGQNQRIEKDPHCGQCCAEYRLVGKPLSGVDDQQGPAREKETMQNSCSNQQERDRRTGKIDLAAAHESAYRNDNNQQPIDHKQKFQSDAAGNSLCEQHPQRHGGNDSKKLAVFDGPVVLKGHHNAAEQSHRIKNDLGVCDADQKDRHRHCKHRAREAGDRLDHIGKENNKKQTKLIQGEIPPFWLQRQF